MNKTFRLFLILTAILSGFVFAPEMKAQFTITENFKGSSVGSNIVLGGNPSAVLTSGVDDPVNEGWLRLTKDATDQRGYAYINTSFPSTLGVYIEFEYKTWRSRTDNGYNGADGISVFLFDATANFSIGAFGGSLGYANKSSESGLAGAYLGIGLDEYGNFAASSEGKNGGGSSNILPNSIVLRGPANHARPYRYLAHNQLQTNASSNVNSIDYNQFVSNHPDDATFYRRVKVYIEPIGTAGNPKYRITVKWTMTPHGNDTELIRYETVDPIPPNLKLGFAASTGSGFNYHEIRNLLITTPGGVRVQKNVDKINANVGEKITYTIDVANETTAALNNLVLSDTIKDGNGSEIDLQDFLLESITFDNRGNTTNTASGFSPNVPVTSGFANPFSTNLSMAANSSSRFTIVGTIKKVPANGVLKNSVGIDPSGSGIMDQDLTNNYSEVNTGILNPNVDLKIEKEVDYNGIARLSGNTYSITVSNVSSTGKPGGQLVTVTDAIPDGLTLVSYAAPGWTVNQTGNTYTFTRSDELKPSYAYPTISLDVKAPEGRGPWTNTADLSYTYDTNTANNNSSVILRWVNYWYGTTDTDWGKDENWTAHYVPSPGENIEFATEINNGTSGDGNGQGAAINDLYLDTDRIIGDLINASDKDLVITTGNQLQINGTVRDGYSAGGAIVVKSDPEKPTGTLIFTDPANNTAVQATVEFYNKAYECADCGFYRRAWQYFGIPVQSSAFPYSNPKVETVNEWSEPVNGNKWMIPSSPLMSFKGYEITNSSTSVPSTLSDFRGNLVVGDANLPLTKTPGVNYSGLNLIGNSYTAAIPISADAIDFTGTWDQNVYLFNTGTRDQWRKLDGSNVYSETTLQSGQYKAVPLRLAGQAGLEDRIPSMHAFMVNAGTTGTLSLKYDRLVKNSKVDGMAWRSAEVTRSAELKPEYIVMDMIGSTSADRVWLFETSGTTTGFDDGWDGRKLVEQGIVQVYVAGEGGERYQVATVPQIQGVTFGWSSDKQESYTLSLAVTPGVEKRNLFLRDLSTDHLYAIRNGAEYTVAGEVVLTPKDRFEVVTGAPVSNTKLNASAVDLSVVDRVITIANHSEEDCAVSVYDILGKLIARESVPMGAYGSIGTLNRLGPGVYIIKLKGDQSLNETRRVMVR